MRLLLDTHAFLWLVAGDTSLSPAARAAIADPGNQTFVSIASAWEVAIKVGLGRLTVDAPTVREFFEEQTEANGFAEKYAHFAESVLEQAARQTEATRCSEGSVKDQRASDGGPTPSSLAAITSDFGCLDWVSRGGFEPPTYGLKVRSSTN